MRIYFKEDSHQYFNESEEEYKSVSYIAKLLDKKDELFWEKKKKKKARELGISVEELTAIWNKKKELGTNAGTLIHLDRERELIENDFEYLKVKHKKRTCDVMNGLKWSIPIEGLENNTVYPELMIYDHDYKICGQSDKVIVTNNTISIQDYKGLCLQTDILTTKGFKKMKDICESDILYDINGEPTNIVNISNVHRNPCYKITFDTKEEILCDHEHKWVLSKRLDKNNYINVELTTLEVYDSFIDKKTLRVPCSAIKGEEKNLCIDPYVLGVWLGDGCKAANRVTNMNPKIWEEIEKRGYKLGKNIDKRTGKKAELRTLYGLRSKLANLNLLKNKHIPEEYYFASYAQRLDLLRGLMDTDGSYNHVRKRCVINTTQKWQAESMKRLINSLGWKATVCKYLCSRFGKKGIPAFQICFTPPVSPFLRKENNFKERETIYSKYRYIINMEKIETVDTKCIAVDSPTKTYLVTTSYIPTHNTDRSIERKAFSNDFVKGEKLKKPVEHLDDCNYNIYSLKLSMYMYMLWKKNKHLKVGKLILEHLNILRDSEGVPILNEFGKPTVLSEELIEVPYLRKEVRDIFEQYKLGALNVSR